MDWKTFAILACLYFVSGVINALLAFKTPEQWQSWCEANPRGRKVLKVLRQVGLDLPGLARLVVPVIARLLERFGRGGK
jgi:hypothetical protein